MVNGVDDVLVCVPLLSEFVAAASCRVTLYVRHRG